MKIIDQKYGLASCRQSELPKRYQGLPTIAFFYQDSLVILNEEAINFEVYSEIIPLFLSLSDRAVHEFMENCPSNVDMHVLHAFKLLIRIKRWRRRYEKA